jgi:hypothetical protein
MNEVIPRKRKEKFLKSIEITRQRSIMPWSAILFVTIIKPSATVKPPELGSTIISNNGLEVNRYCKWINSANSSQIFSLSDPSAGADAN